MGCNESKLLLDAAAVESASAAESKSKSKNGQQLRYKSVPLKGSLRKKSLAPVIEADREDTSATEEEDALGIEMEARDNEYQYYNDERYVKRCGGSYDTWDYDDTTVDQDDNTIVRIDKRQKHAFKLHVKRYYHETLINQRTGECIELPPPRLEFPKQRIAI
ncbi:MAG: hypothetical protein SGILL_006511 [Bacillariaceae sp.]